MTRSSCSGRERAARMAFGGDVSRSENSSRSAPRPTIPRQINPSAGAAMTPRIGDTLADQADIDGVFAAPGDEFARAVERIDEEEAPALDGRCLPFGSLLGNDRQNRLKTRQAVGDDGFRGFVRGGDRRRIALDAHAIAFPVRAADRLRGGDADGGEFAHEAGADGHVENGHGRLFMMSRMESRPISRRPQSRAAHNCGAV